MSDITSPPYLSDWLISACGPQVIGRTVQWDELGRERASIAANGSLVVSVLSPPDKNGRRRLEGFILPPEALPALRWLLSQCP